MSWRDRLREAALTAPDGTRITFDFEDVSKSFDKKTSAFDAPDADGTYIQEFGNTGGKYPIRIFFWGSDYDIEAANFEKNLRQRGDFTLDHPAYGVIKVVPFGTISRKDSLTSAGNQAVFDITFWETTGLIYPSSQQDSESSIPSAVDSCNRAAANLFSGKVDLSTVFNQSQLNGEYTAVFDITRQAIESLASVDADVNTLFNTISQSIDSSLDLLITDPEALAAQTIILIQSVTDLDIDIKGKLSVFSNLGRLLRVRKPKNNNALQTFDLYCNTYLAASVMSVAGATFSTKQDAVSAAEDLLAQLDEVVTWRDDNYNALSVVDTGESYAPLLDSVALAAGYLVASSFDLKQEYSLVLDRARTIIDLAGELYGEIDEKLNFLIDTNNFSGSEIMEIPKGRTVLYYV